MASILGKEADIVILTKAQYHGAEPTELEKNIDTSKKEVILTTNVKEAILQAKEMANEKDLIMVLGGLYLGAEAKKIVEEVF